MLVKILVCAVALAAVILMGWLTDRLLNPSESDDRPACGCRRQVKLRIGGRAPTQKTLYARRHRLLPDETARSQPTVSDSPDNLGSGDADSPTLDHEF